MKFVKYILCVAILLSTVSGVYAAEDADALAALKMVKERVDTSEYDNFSSSYYKDDDGETTYSFEWSKNDEKYSELYMSVKDGIIVSYSKYEYYGGELENRFALSSGDAEKIAREFLKRMNPEICDSIAFLPEDAQSVYSDYYSIELCRMENGIPVLNETGNIDVSKRTHEVSHFYINYSKEIDFKPLDNVIGEEAAKAAYTELVPLVLRYKYNTDYSKKTVTPYLEYATKDGIVAINALDGSLYEAADDWRHFYGYAAEKSMADESGGTGGLSPAELEETERIAGLMTEEQVERAVMENSTIAMPQGVSKSRVSFNRNAFNKEEYYYNIDFNGEDKYVSTTVNAKTGEIIGFYKYIDKDMYEDKQDRATEERLAKQAFKALAGDKYEEFRIEDSEYTGGVQFVRTYDGLDVLGDGAHVDFDLEDNITGYNLSYKSGMTFPSKNGVISAKDAFLSAFDALGFELGYEVDYAEKTATPIYYIGKSAKIEQFTMNPFTAHITDYKGDDIEERKPIAYTDIDGHYGKDIFKELADYGVGFTEDKLEPDKPVTQAEYFTLLNSAFGYEADRDEIYRNFIQQGTIKAEERADDSILTRENAAIFMIREMGAEDYAKHEEIYVAPFEDVNINKGYIAILKAKGVVNGDGSGKFHPQNTVTRGEALIMIYNYFTK